MASTDRIITERQCQQLLDYLVKMPYAQVYRLVGMVMNLSVLDDSKEEKDVKNDSNHK